MENDYGSNVHAGLEKSVCFMECPFQSVRFGEVLLKLTSKTAVSLRRNRQYFICEVIQRKMYIQRSNRQRQIQFSRRYKLVKMGDFFLTYKAIKKTTFLHFSIHFLDLTNRRYIEKNFTVPPEFVKTRVHCISIYIFCV